MPRAARRGANCSHQSRIEAVKAPDCDTRASDPGAASGPAVLAFRSISGRWNPRQLGEVVGYMPQDVELFAGSVAENIARMGDVDDAQVVAAAQRAG